MTHRSARTHVPGTFLVLALLLVCGGCGGAATDEPAGAGAAEVGNDGTLPLLELWEQGLTAFGVFVPNERPPGEAAAAAGERPAPLYTAEGGARLARNPRYDYLFLNLEGRYDVAAAEAIAEGLRSPEAVSRKALLVRIPPLERDGEEVTRRRVQELLALGADGVVFPHIRNVQEARTAVSFFQGANVWSPSNPGGNVVAMLMVEDPEAVAEAGAIADVGGYSVLACGIGSLTGALGGDRGAAEQGNQQVLAETKRVGLADMITADAGDVEQRVEQGFLALLMMGPDADDAIRAGRAAAGRAP